MDTSDTTDQTVATDEEFSDALNSLIQEAYANGVDIEGGWECRTTAERPDWDIVILEVEKDLSSEHDRKRSAYDP
jgi:hypothetical protein